MLALATVAALVPAAAGSWTAGTASAGSPVSVRLDGSLTTTGLPAAAALSELTLRNDGLAPVRWTVETTVEGSARSAVTIEPWVRTGTTCDAAGVRLQPGRWSSTTLEAGASLPLCVRISDDGTSPGSARPTLAVHARTA